MGSTPSTPNRESSDDPWWPLEYQNLDLNPNAMDETTNNSTNSNGHEQSETNTDICGASIHILENRNNEGKSENEVECSSLNESSSSSSNSNTSQSNCTKVALESNSAKIEKFNRQQSLEQFKEELRIKREMRTNAISELRNEITNLRRQLSEEKEINKHLIAEQNNENLCQICCSIYKSLEAPDTIERNVLTIDENRETNVSLRSQLAELQCSLQNANSEILTLSSELAATKQQAKSLKEVIVASKEIIEIRETELSQLKSKFKEIENSLAEREMHMMSENLRQEYDRQLANIRNLRALYEERARISAAEKENLHRQLETSRAELSSENEKNKNLEDHIASLNVDLKSTTEELYATKEKLIYYKAENKDLHDEMTVVNQLFGQLLAGFNGDNNIDIDKLTLMLEENRDLLNDITSKENCKEGAAQIPKLIFDLVSQADKKTDNEDETIHDCPSTSTSTSIDDSSSAKITSAQEIIHNLPKVWKVLTELLNHQQLKPVPLKGANQHELCYKSVQTPTGPQMVLSVSKTYIRLKDLIMEKKFLQKETKKLKNLNSHLECRLGEQEQRLGAVTIELNKTWNLVGRMQRQHRQLHTHEQVLRYQLQQKRRMLNELKDELEYCRRKWALAKEKNIESQSQWETLRHEFSQRKESDLNNSGESGYSDCPISEEEEEEEGGDDEDSSISLEQPRNSRMKKKINLEQFLLTADQKDRKAVRIQSVSPVRNAREVLTRRNSDSHITQFATEVFQASTDVVQPIENTICAECCAENCVKHSVHFEERQQATDQVKVSEAIVRNPKPQLTNAQKLIEAKAATTQKKMCCELRKPTNVTKSITTEESLEEMFLRLSGSNENATNQNIETQNETSRETSVELSEQDERKARRIARIERLEGQCKLLMTQVIRASNRGDELNQHADDINSKYSPEGNVSLNQNCEESQISKPSTSGIQKTNSVKTDYECLSATEREYLTRRDERLTRLEAESQAYLNHLKSMSHRASSVDSLTNHDATNQTQQFKTDEQSSTSIESNAECSIAFASKTDEECLTKTEQDYLARRDERLKRLEAESQAYLNRMKSMKQRAASVDTKLDAIRSRVENLPQTTENVTNCIDNMQPSTSGTQNTAHKTVEECLSTTEQNYLSRREERLKRLEAETEAYMNRVKSTNRRATDVDTKLEYLHGRYGNNETEATENRVNEITEMTELTSSNDTVDALLNQDDNDETNQSTENPPNHENSSN